MPRSKEEILWNKRQAIWFQSCARTHSLFCNCGNWFDHIKRRWDFMVSGDILKREGHVVDGFIVAGGGDGFPGEEPDSVDGTPR